MEVQLEVEVELIGPVRWSALEDAESADFSPSCVERISTRPVDPTKKLALVPVSRRLIKYLKPKQMSPDRKMSSNNVICKQNSVYSNI